MSAQKCLREGCSRKVDSTTRGEVFCYQHRDNVADATGAAKAKTLSEVGPIPLRRERIEHSDPEFGGVPEAETEEPLEGTVIDSPEQREAAQRAEREEEAQIKAMLDELRMLHPIMEAYEKTAKRYTELKTTLRDRLPATPHDLNGVEFVINEKDVFDPKLAAAAAVASVDADGNRIKPIITKGELEQISVMTPSAAMASSVFKNRPEILRQLKKPQRSISIKAVKPVEAAKAADAA